MKGSCVLAIVFGLFFAGCGGDKNKAKDVFTDFREAVMSDQDEADGFISRGSLDYLENVMSWVFRGEREGISKLSLFDRYLVLSIRMEYGEWGQEDWEEWLEERKSRGAVVLDERLKRLLRPFLIDRKLGNVGSYGGVVGGQLLKSGFPTERRVAFVEEDGWKVDLIALWRSDYEILVKPYLTDEYRNTDRVEALLRDGFGDRFNSTLYRSRLKMNDE